MFQWYILSKRLGDSNGTSSSSPADEKFRLSHCKFFKRTSFSGTHFDNIDEVGAVPDGDRAKNKNTRLKQRPILALAAINGQLFGIHA